MDQKNHQDRHRGNQGVSPRVSNIDSLLLPVDSSISSLIAEAIEFKERTLPKPAEVTNSPDIAPLCARKLKNDVSFMASLDLLDSDTVREIAKALYSLYEKNGLNLGEAIATALKGELWFITEGSLDCSEPPGKQNQWVNITESDKNILLKVLLYGDPEFIRKVVPNALSVNSQCEIKVWVDKLLKDLSGKELDFFLDRLSETKFAALKNAQELSGFTKALGGFLKGRQEEVFSILKKIRSNCADDLEECTNAKAIRALESKSRTAYNLIFSFFSHSPEPHRDLPQISYLYREAHCRDNLDKLRRLFSKNTDPYAYGVSNIANDQDLPSEIRICAMRDAVQMLGKKSLPMFSGLLKEPDPVIVLEAVYALSRNGKIKGAVTELIINDLLEKQSEKNASVTLAALFWLGNDNKVYEILKAVLSRVDFAKSVFSFFYDNSFTFPYDRDLKPYARITEPKIVEDGIAFSAILLRFGMENLLNLIEVRNGEVRENMNNLLSHLIKYGSSEEVFEQLQAMDLPTLHKYQQIYMNEARN